MFTGQTPGSCRRCAPLSVGRSELSAALRLPIPALSLWARALLAFSLLATLRCSGLLVLAPRGAGPTTSLTFAGFPAAPGLAASLAAASLRGRFFAAAFFRGPRAFCDISFCGRSFGVPVSRRGVSLLVVAACAPSWGALSLAPWCAVVWAAALCALSLVPPRGSCPSPAPPGKFNPHRVPPPSLRGACWVPPPGFVFACDGVSCDPGFSLRSCGPGFCGPFLRPRLLRPGFGFRSTRCRPSRCRSGPLRVRVLPLFWLAPVSWLWPPLRPSRWRRVFVHCALFPSLSLKTRPGAGAKPPRPYIS